MNKTAEKTEEKNTREPRPEKVELVQELKSLFETSQGVVFTEYRGLDVASMKELRIALNGVGTSYKVYKNTLIKRAVAELKLNDMFVDLLKGPVGLAFVSQDADYSASARVFADYKKLNKVLVVKAGYCDGILMDETEYDVFSKLPAIEVLQAQFAFALKAPLNTLVGLMNSVLQKFAGQLGALYKKMEAENPAEEPAVEVTEEEPATEEPEETEEEPATEEADESPAEESVVEETEDEPATEEPAVEEEAQEEPATEEEPLADEPDESKEEPATEEADENPAEEPVVEEETEEVTEQEPATEEPATEEEPTEDQVS